MSSPASVQTPAADDLFSPPPERVRVDYFGEITVVDIWDAVLRKGAGKVKFDPFQHSDDEKRVVANLQLTCTSKDGHTFTIDQEEINTSAKWRKTLASLQALGITSRVQLLALKGQWAHARRVPTGGTYLAKSGAQAGQQVPEQALSFLALYPDQATCDLAEAVFWEIQRQRPGAPPVNGSALPTDDLPLPPASDNDKDIALKAAGMLWKVSGHDKTLFANMLAQSPVVNRHYRMTSPEIVQLISGAIDEDDPLAPF